jgi:hypothetical protein
MTEAEKINQVFDLLKRAIDMRDVGAIKAFSFSWDTVSTGQTKELMPRLNVEYWPKPTD